MAFSDERWVPTLSFEVVWLDNRFHICKRGGKWVNKSIADGEMSFTAIAEARSYDEAISILRALRAAQSGESEGER